MNFKELAHFGTAIGGIFTIVSILLLYQTLTYQIKTSKKQSKAGALTQFESRVFELLRYHRENVEVTEMRNPNDYGDKYYRGHKAFREIYRQFSELLGYVSSYLADISLQGIYLDNALLEREVEILKAQGVKPNQYKKVNEINIAYLILFYGVDKEGRLALEAKLGSKYDVGAFSKLLDNLSKRIALWSIKDGIVTNDLEEWVDLDGKKPYRAQKIKFYGGHQYRLGHYFRHLFQTITYIDNNGMFYDENYEYIKIVRAQLSSYEQKLLFINSISDLGRAWEINVQKYYDGKLTMDMTEYIKAKTLITKFDLVKNIPNNLEFISISDIYPNLVFEGDIVDANRQELNLIYKKGYY